MGSTLGSSADQTASLVRLPASRAMERDLHGAVVDLRHLQLEQALDQAGVGAGDEDLGPAAGAADLHHIDLQARRPRGPPRPGPARRGRGKRRWIRRRWSMRRVTAPLPGIHAGDGTPVSISCSLELNIVVDHAVLGLPHALDDDLPGRLGGDAAEVPGLDLDADHVAALGGGQALAGLGQGDFGGGVRRLPLRSSFLTYIRTVSVISLASTNTLSVTPSWSRL